MLSDWIKIVREERGMRTEARRWRSNDAIRHTERSVVSSQFLVGG
ncbi:hypothetical protein PHOSAC3_120495 [Mesotoga infera]|nr:hypothetical protein PHOSAC3_120495 [Mesotoga infera]